MFKVAVIGAGVNGLASAWCLAQKFTDVEITLIASEFYPEKVNICSSHGFGIVGNRGGGVVDGPNLTKFVKETQKFCSSVHPTEAEYAGIRPRDAIVIFNEEQKVIDKKADRQKLGYREVAQNELVMFAHVAEESNRLVIFEAFSKAPVKMYKFPVYVIDNNKYLPWLMNKLQQKYNSNREKMVSVLKQEVSSFQDLASYDLVVNCSGCGAKQLADDPMVVPVRGQYMKLDAPYVDKVYIAGDIVITPQSNYVCAGATSQYGRSETHLHPGDSHKLRYQCETLFPALNTAKLISAEVGVRPARIGGARLELENVIVDEKKLPVIHNYGHGPRGYAQHMGCAIVVADLASKILSTTSKL